MEGLSLYPLKTNLMRYLFERITFCACLIRIRTIPQLRTIHAERVQRILSIDHKNAKEVAQVFQWIYENTPLTYPKTLIIDDGKEFYGDVTKLTGKHDVMIQGRDPSQHRSQGIVERFNRTLADRLFSISTRRN